MATDHLSGITCIVITPAGWNVQTCDKRGILDLNRKVCRQPYVVLGESGSRWACNIKVFVREKWRKLKQWNSACPRSAQIFCISVEESALLDWKQRACEPCRRLHTYYFIVPSKASDWKKKNSPEGAMPPAHPHRARPCLLPRILAIVDYLFLLSLLVLGYPCNTKP